MTQLLITKEQVKAIAEEVLAEPTEEPLCTGMLKVMESVGWQQFFQIGYIHATFKGTPAEALKFFALGLRFLHNYVEGKAPEDSDLALFDPMDPNHMERQVEAEDESSIYASPEDAAIQYYDTNDLAGAWFLWETKSKASQLLKYIERVYETMEIILCPCGVCEPGKDATELPQEWLVVMYIHPREHVFSPRHM